MILYGLYDTQDNDLCIGIFNINEIEKVFGISRHSFYSSVSKGSLIKKRYEIAKFDENELKECDNNN